MLIHSFLFFYQNLSICVENDDLMGQARAFGTLADIYRQTGQLIKAHDYYKKVRYAQNLHYFYILFVIACVCI